MQPDEKAALTIRDLLVSELIPNDPLFAITEEHINAFIRIYDTYSMASEAKYKNYARRINYTFNRKMAGRDLIRFKQQLGAKANQCREGFIYSIGNPAWPNYLKLGRTTDVIKRLASYQTYSPHRDYYRAHYEFVLDTREFEKLILKEFGQTLDSGEWISDTTVKEIIAFVNARVPRTPSWAT